MNILYVWDADYPWDIRVEKICKSLVEAGHNVHIASRNLNNNSIYELSEGLHIHRIKAWENKKINYLYSFPVFFNPVWKKLLDNIILQYSIHLIIVRDLPIAIAGIWAGKRHQAPVVFDMAEDYVAMLKGIWKIAKFKGLNLVIRNPYLGKLIEKYVFKHVDHTLVVVDEAKEVATRNNIDTDKVTIVSNTPTLSSFDNEQVQHVPGEEGELIRHRYSAIYTGGIQKGRGIQTVIDAIPDIIKEISDFLFVVVGDGYATEYFKQQINEKGIDEYVLWVGWVSHDNLYSYINDSQLGLIPHFANEHVNTTIPNKLFDYMALGLPVLVSNAPPLERIVNDENCGRSYQSGNAVDLTSALVQLFHSDMDFSLNARRAVRSRYNWECDAKALLQVIEKFNKC